jgi:nucleoside 2-deoxyribosyltransferase
MSAGQPSHRRRVFLSGMIDGLSLEESSAWRLKAGAALEDAGFDTYDPTRVMRAAGQQYQPAPIEVFTNDRWNLARCDVVLANLALPKVIDSSKAPFFSIGELFLAHAAGLPIIVFGKTFRGRAGYEAIVTKTFDEMDDAIAYIVAHYR